MTVLIDPIRIGDAGPTPVEPLISDEEFARLQQTDGSVRGYELLDGVLSPMPPTLSRQSTPWGRLFARLSIYVEEHNLGEAWLDLATYLDPGRKRWRLFPDIAYLATSELHKLQSNRINDAPTMVCQVVTDPSRHHDYVTKMDAYRTAGVPWYWIVDADEAVTREYHLVGGEFRLVSETPFDQPFSPQLFPGFQVTLERRLSG